MGADTFLQAPDAVTLEGAVGSATLGVKANYNLERGISLQGGAAFVADSNSAWSMTSAPLFATSIRYLDPGAMPFRPFGETGLWGSPSLMMHFSRDYSGGAGAANVSGSMFSIFGRAGVLYAPDIDDQVVFSATLAQNWLQVGAYDETTTNGNLFPAHVDTATFSTPTVKASLSWSRVLTPTLDFTLSAAIGRTFGRTPLIADVDWIGPVSAGAEDVTFAELGARLGLKVGADTTANLFAVDTVSDKFANHFQLGGGLKINF